jgi:hypothetical protein
VTAHEIVIRLGRPFDIQTGDGAFLAGVREITVPFGDRESAESAHREITVHVRPVHDAGGEDYRSCWRGSHGTGCDRAVSKRTRVLLIAAVWACCAAACALITVVPAAGSAVGRVEWPFGVFAGAVIGWHERGRAADGKLPLFDQLLLIVLAAFTSELIVPGLWAYIPVTALLGVSAWLIWRARRHP